MYVRPAICRHWYSTFVVMQTRQTYTLCQHWKLCLFLCLCIRRHVEFIYKYMTHQRSQLLSGGFTIVYMDVVIVLVRSIYPYMCVHMLESWVFSSLLYFLHFACESVLILRQPIATCLYYGHFILCIYANKLPAARLSSVQTSYNKGVFFQLKV